MGSTQSTWGVWSSQWVRKDQDHHGQQEWNPGAQGAGHRGALQVQRDGRRPGEGALQRLPHRPPQWQDEAQGVQRDGREDDAKERRVQDGEARLKDPILTNRNSSSRDNSIIIIKVLIGIIVYDLDVELNILICAVAF